MIQPPAIIFSHAEVNFQWPKGLTLWAPAWISQIMAVCVWVMFPVWYKGEEYIGPDMIKVNDLNLS